MVNISHVKTKKLCYNRILFQPSFPRFETTDSHQSPTQMFRRQDIQELHSVFHTMDSPELLQFVQQMRLPIRASELFTFDHSKKTAVSMPKTKLVQAIQLSIAKSSSKVRGTWNWFYVTATMAMAISTLLSSLIYFDEYATYGFMNVVIVRLKATLAKKTFWDNWLMKLKVPTPTISLYADAKSFILHVLKTFEQQRNNYKLYNVFDPSLMSSIYSAKTYYKYHEGILRPGVFLLKAMAVLILLNTLIKIVIPKRNYAVYARKLANPKWDELETYDGPYDGCLERIDTKYHHVFEEIPETAISTLRYQLLKMHGRRRTIELWHLVRADGTMRTNFNEIAHAIAKPNTWSKYCGDMTYKMKRMIRGVSHSGTRRRNNMRVTGQHTRKKSKRAARTSVTKYSHSRR